jgi:hypothetical protein
VLHFDLFRTLRVKRVADSTGRELQFIQANPNEDSDLNVIFPEPLKRGMQTLEFEYAGAGALTAFGSGNFALEARQLVPEFKLWRPCDV